MSTILLLHGESESSKLRLQDVAGSKVTQRLSDGMPSCNCDRWGHLFPDCIEHNLRGRTYLLRTRIATWKVANLYDTKTRSSGTV